MAFTAWAAGASISLGDVRRATTAQPSGLVFKCTTAGTTAGSEPTWPTDIGSTITDNSVVWTAVSAVYEELAVLEPNTIIELFELHLDATLHGSSDIYRWHSGSNADVTGNIVFNSETYYRQPIIASGFEYANTGTLPRPTLTVSNLDSTITTVLLLVNAVTPGNDLGGALVKRIRTLLKFLDGQSAADPYATFPEEQWYIDRKSKEDRNEVAFELASKFDVPGQMLPKRQLIANICQWEYRSSECSYSGSNYFDVNDNSVGSLSQDKCGKRLSSCKKRFGETGELPFGSFPSVGMTK
tara:strand:- start:2619 stop:3512 length:894 start_codon:yes stop_codon:yes gene_type:complete